jgi:hypothetical protein
MTFKCKHCEEFIKSNKQVKQNKKIVLQLSNNIFAELPICAFDKNGKFKKHNWSCITMMKLRELSVYHGWNNDESIDVIPTKDGKFIVLTYYKGRGKTGGALVVCDDEKPRKITLNEAYKIIGG